MNTTRPMFGKTLLQRLVRGAFLQAQRTRIAAGLKPGEASIRRSRSGARLVGPASYRITMHIPAWVYGDLVERHNRSGADCSLVTFMVRQLAGQNRAARAAGRRVERRAAA